MIKVHHLENSRSQRVLWLLEELELEYEIVEYARDPETMLAPSELKKVHPLGKSPVITDDEITVAESGAIIDYLIERYDTRQRLIPAPDSADHRHYRYWLHCAEGSAMPLLVMKLVFSRLGKPPVPLPMRPIGNMFANGVKSKFLDPQIRQHLDFWEGILGKSSWFAGEQFTAADIQMSFPLLAIERQGGAGVSPRYQGMPVAHARAHCVSTRHRQGRRTQSLGVNDHDLSTSWHQKGEYGGLQQERADDRRAVAGDPGVSITVVGSVGI